MTGEKNLEHLVRSMNPKLNDGLYVFLTLNDLDKIQRNDTLFEFKEEEGITVILEKSKADILKLKYEYVASWITLQVHSSLEAIGLTALFATELSKYSISCNVVAGYFHDHIFVAQEDADKALHVLTNLSKNYA